MAILFFGAVIGAGLLVPVYVDEVASKIPQAGYLAEGGRMVSLFPQCADSFIRDTPVTWRPAALAYAVLYRGLEPLGLRLAGLAVCLAWLLAIWAWSGTQGAGRNQRIEVTAAVTSVASLGVLPLTFVLARAEQWIVLLLTCFLAFPAIARSSLARRLGMAGDLAALGTFLLATSLLSFAHPKALFFLPLVVASAWFSFPDRRRILALIATVFAAASAYESARFAATGMQCEDAPVLASMLQSQVVSPGAMIDHPGEFFRALAGNLVEAPGEIASLAKFQPEYESGWLPRTSREAIAGWISGLNQLITLAIYVVCLAGLLLPLSALMQMRRRDGQRVDRSLAVVLWIGYVAHLAFYQVWHFYTGGVVLVVGAMLAVLSIRTLEGVPRLHQLAVDGRIALLILSLMSLSTLMGHVVPGLWAAARTSAMDLPGQPYSVKVFGYAPTRQKVRELADACGLKGDGARRLVIDDATYFAFSGLRQPLHAVLLAPGGWGRDIAGRTREFLVAVDSAGIIARCNFLAVDLVDEVVRDGNLCCVNLSRSPASAEGQ